MRLEVIVKYLLRSNLIRIALFVTGFSLYSSTNCKSQVYKLDFKENTSLSDALTRASRTFGFKVAFDAGRLRKVMVDKSVKAATINEFVDHLLQNTGFTYLYKHGSYLIVEAPALKVQKTKTCVISGSVIDGQSGEQLPFASVILPAQNIAVSTTSNGTFSLKEVVSNPVLISIRYLGYFAFDTLVNWNSQNIFINFKLQLKPTILDSINVKATRLEMVDYRNDMDYSAAINPSKLIDLPVLAETDIFKTLQLLPGINYAENSSELSIQGGSSDQNLILFDGQTLYNLSHYFGVFSSINPFIVKDIQVFKAGFDSRYGERISGIVDITGKSGNLMKPVFIANINLLSANMAVELPISKKLTIVSTARRSYSDIYSTDFASNLFEKKIPVLREEANRKISVSEPKFNFYDFNTRLNYRISNDENIALSLYGGKDYFRNEYYLNTPSFNISNLDSSSIYNYGASLNWQKQWNPSWFSVVSAGTSGSVNNSYNTTKINRLKSGGHEDRFLPDTINIFNTHSKNNLDDYYLSLRNTFNINNFNQMDFGFLFRNNNIYYYKDADDLYIYDNTHQSAWLTSIFFQDRIQIANSLSLKPGFRMSYFNGNQKFYIEPRFKAKYMFNENFSCRFAFGRYYQFISQVNVAQETSYFKNFWVLANDSVNPVVSSDHYTVGLNFKHKNLLFDAEAYYKRYSGIQEYIFLSQFTRNTEFRNYFPRRHNYGQQEPLSAQPSYFINGSGTNYGIDFFVRYKTGNYTGWISYSTCKSLQKFEQINRGEEIPSLQDQAHQMSISNLLALGNWNLGTVLLFSTGKPYLVSSGNERNLPIIREYGTMPNFFRFDVSANYNFQIKTAHLKTGVSVINLFNTQNYLDTNTRIYDFENSSFSETNLIKSQNLSLNLFLQIAI